MSILAEECEWAIKVGQDGGALEDEGGREDEDGREDGARDWNEFRGPASIVWRGAKGSGKESELVSGRSASGGIGL